MSVFIFLFYTILRLNSQNCGLRKNPPRQRTQEASHKEQKDLITSFKYYNIDFNYVMKKFLKYQYIFVRDLLLLLREGLEGEKTLKV